MKHDRYHSKIRYHELVSGNASHETTVVRLELTMSSHRNALRAALKIDPELYVVGVKICVYTRNDSESVGTSSRKWNDGRNAFPDPEPDPETVRNRSE